jgi:protein-glutamine gamma-glutamyltransferase
MQPGTRQIKVSGGKTPPGLLGVALLFWGWQTGFPGVGLVLAAGLEGARFIKTRWEFSDEDFHRLANLCALLVPAAMILVFITSDGPGGFGSLFHATAGADGSKVGNLGGRAAIVLLRWLPMILFPLFAAQLLSASGSVPLTALSLALRWRRRSEQKSGRVTVPDSRMDVSYPYLIVCLFSAGIHTNPDNDLFFWGLSLLLAWALWPLRSRRYGIVIWVAAFALAIALGYLGQRGLGRLEQLAENRNTRWLLFFMRHRTSPRRSVTALGQIGHLKLSGNIIIRLRPKGGEPPPLYLREASYQNYRAGTWMAGRRYDFDYLPHETNETTWVLVPGKTNRAEVNIACYLNGTFRESYNPAGLLPLPPGCGQLRNLSAYLLQKNRTGNLLAEGPRLVIFDAEYGPGPGFDSFPDTNWDFLVPSNEMPALSRVISEMKLAGRDEAETLQRVRGFFRGQFSYSTWLGPDKSSGTNDTPLARFLLKRRSGHCEYFATATVLLLRQLNIPARYAVGYGVHEPAGNGFVVRERDAHAWCLVWNQANRIWEDFDTTPASWMEIEGQHASPWQWLSDWWSEIGFQIAKLRWRQMEWRRNLLWVLAPVLVLMLGQILFRLGQGRRRRRRSAELSPVMFWPGLDSEFYQLEQRLAGRGVARRSSEPLSDWLARALADPVLGDLRAPLQKLLQLHYRYRFDPHGLEAAERRALEREAKACLDLLARTKNGGKLSS